MANTQNLKISGMLNQHEFKERYIFTMQRIINGFSRHEMAFLLGRTNYDINDYEHLHEHVKMSYKDYEIMALVFKNRPPSVPVFQTRADNIDISSERRMIRGTVWETESERQFHFVHPWWIFRCIVRHDSATKYATHSGAKYASIPLERLPFIPLQSTPLC